MSTTRLAFQVSDPNSTSAEQLPATTSSGPSSSSASGTKTDKRTPLKAPLSKPPPQAPKLNVSDAKRSEESLHPKNNTVVRHDVLPFWISRQTSSFQLRALTLPPLFLHRKPLTLDQSPLLHLDLSLTFGWYDKKNQKRRWMNPLGLYFGAFSPHKSVWAALPLLMAYKRVGEQFNFGQFPLIWWWGNKHAKNFLVLPAFFRHTNPRGALNVGGLVVWRGTRDLHDKDPTNDLRYLVVFPTYLRLKKGLASYDISPIYIGGKNEKTGHSHSTLLPFFHWQSIEHGNRHELWTPFWIDRKDRARQKRSWAIPPLLSFSTQNSKRSLFSATPLVWRAKNHLKSSQSWFFGPFGSYRDPHQSNQWLAPLWWQFRDTRYATQTSLLVPLLYHRKGPQDSTFHTPMFSFRRDKSEQQRAWKTGIHPLLSYFGHSPRHDYQVIFGGLAWHSQKRSASGEHQVSRFGIGPLVYHSRRKDQRHFGIVPLLLFAGRNHTKSYQSFTPLLWHLRDRDPARQSRALIIGPAYGQRSIDGWKGGLAPLWLGANESKFSYQIMPPLLTGYVHNKKERRKTLVSPIFAYHKTPTSRTIGVLGLGWDVKRPKERHSVLAPFYYRRQIGAHVWAGTPIGGYHIGPKTQRWIAGPIFGGRNGSRRSFGIFPVLFTQRDSTPGKQGNTVVIPPLFVRSRQPDQSTDMWSPLIWRSKVRGPKPRSGFAILPFYAQQREKGGVDLDAGLGWFYARNPSRKTHLTVAGPFFHRLTRKRLDTGLAPLSWWMDSEKKRRFIGLPLIVHNENKIDQSHFTVAVPFWFDRQASIRRRSWMAFPVIFGIRRSDNFLRMSIAPPGFFDIFRLKENYRFTGMVPLLYRYQKCGFQAGDSDKCRYTVWGSFPLFMYGHDGMGRLSHSALGLYYFDRDKGGKKLFTWVAGVNYRPKERLQWYAGPVYRDTTRENRTTAVFPLFYRKAHRIKKIHTTLVLPPLFVAQRKRESRWFEAALLYWQFRDPHQITTIVLPPVFGIQHAFAERKLSWLAPIFVRDNHMGKNSAWTAVFPGLFVQHRKNNDRTTVQFPLVWHFKREENHTTVGGAIWYDIKRGDIRTQIVPGLYVRRKTTTRTSHVIGPGIAWWWKEQPLQSAANEPKENDRKETTKAIEAKKAHDQDSKTTEDRHWRALLGLIGGGRVNGRRYVHILGARIGLGKSSPHKSQSPSQRAARSRRSTRQSTKSKPRP